MSSADDSRHPLAGAVLCCTSISPDKRTELGCIGTEMGATIKLDLTSDVTHLIVGDIDSAKYRYVACEREDVKVLLPGWLGALRLIWMTGDTVDVKALEDEYRLPTFYGLRICLTGFDDPEQRKHLQESVIRHGGEYHGDLTKAVTHLIAASPTGKKYEHAVNWGMKIVSWEWFVQSCERGMTLNEACFHPSIPPEKRGKGAWNRILEQVPAQRKRTRDVGQNEPGNLLRRKLRRAASTKMGSQSAELWAGITAAGLDRKQDAVDDWTTEEVLQKVEPGDEDGHEVHHRSSNSDLTEQNDMSLQTTESTDLSLFQGRVIFTHQFAQNQTEILHSHLQSNGANVVSSVEELERLPLASLARGAFVVPHDVPLNLESHPPGTDAMILATNWWIEDCLHSKKFLDPSEHILRKPFYNGPIDGFKDLSIHPTGFTDMDLLHVTRAMTLLGANHSESLTADSSVMVCDSAKPKPEKVKFASDRRVPVVHVAWLWSCIKDKKVHPYTEFLITPASLLEKRNRPQAHLPAIDAPTAALSKEDSFKLQQKKATIRKHPDNGTKQGQSSGKLDLVLSELPLSANSPSFSTEANTKHQTSTAENEDPLPEILDDTSSVPLQAINPGVNSPRRPSTASNTSTTHQSTKFNSKDSSRSTSVSEPPFKPASRTRNSRHAAKDPSPDSVLPPPDSFTAATGTTASPDSQESIAIISMFVGKGKLAADAAPKDEKRRPHKRALGRANSIRVNNVAPDDANARADVGSEVAYNEDDDGEEEDARKQAVEYQPSQVLGWQETGAKQRRDKMIRAMGGVVQDDDSVLEGIGVVKDAVVDTTGTRSGRRKKG